MPRGVRLNPEHDERTRAKIQTSQIINRLTRHVKGEIEMLSTQVRAAEILLRKTLPDLSSMQLEAPPPSVRPVIVEFIGGNGETKNISEFKS